MLWCSATWMLHVSQTCRKQWQPSISLGGSLKQSIRSRGRLIQSQVRRNKTSPLRDDLLRHYSGDIGQPKIAARVVVRESCMIQAHEMQHGRVEIVNVH